MTVIIFIIVLAVLIFVHELGHFLAARANGIRVDEFKLGFGPRLVSWGKGETKYGINLIPFGGYVKIFGENPDDENTNGPDRARSFVHKKRYQQVIVLVAGVAFNFIFAWILYSGAFVSGVTATTDGFEGYKQNFSNARVMITDVSAGSPAEKAGIGMGDVVSEVKVPASVSSSSDKPVSVSTDISAAANTLTVEAVQNSINQSNGNPIQIHVLRKDVDVSITVSPVSGIVDGKYAIGVALQNVADLRLPFFAAVYEGGRYTLMMTRDTAVGLYTFVANIFHGTAHLADVTGPVGIAGIVGSAATLGFTYLVMITALISINLGVINLIPFPALDGGRTLFVLIEGIARRRIPARFSNIVNAVGFALLMILMVVVTYKDIVKLIK